MTSFSVMSAEVKGHRAWVAALGCLGVLLLASSCWPAQSFTAAPVVSRPSPGGRNPEVLASPSPSPSPPTVSGTAVVINHGTDTVRAVLLTFDAGADRGYAPQILDELEAAGLHATFGVTGMWAEENADLVRRMVADGDVIVNHTYDHRSFTGHSTHGRGLPADQRLSEIEHADDVLTQIAGRSPRPWFRIPYGDGDPSVDAQVAQAGYRDVLGWTVDSLGWQGLSATSIVRRCLQRATPGAIYLFHVGSRSQDYAALPAIISGLQAQGYSFETAADLTG